MTRISTFIQVLAALWIVGAAVASGYYLSRRDRNKSTALIGIAWSAVFSWAFVGWLAGEVTALAFKNLSKNYPDQKPSRP